LKLVRRAQAEILGDQQYQHIDQRACSTSDTENLPC
jgi:hypothetical protein